MNTEVEYVVGDDGPENATSRTILEDRQDSSPSPEVVTREIIIVADSEPESEDNSAGSLLHEKNRSAAAGFASAAQQGRDDAEAEFTACPICYEPWTCSGQHRVVSLKCGHLFGQSCIARWLNQRQRCPQCNGRARPVDVRPIYATHVTAVDNTAIEEARRDAERERVRRQAAEEEARRVKQRMAAEVAALQAELAAARRQMLSAESGASNKARRLSQQPQACAEAADACTDGHAVSSILIPARKTRSFDLSIREGMVVFSDSAPNGTFSLQKVSFLAPNRPFQTALHPGSGLVRDVQLSQDGAQAAVACIGSFPIQVVSVRNQTPVATFPFSSSAWSCAWDTACEHRLFSGLQDGGIAVFDLRRMSGPVCVLRSPDTRQPVHTVQVSPLPGPCKLLSASIGGVYAWTLPGSADDDGGSSQQLSSQPLGWDPSQLEAQRLVPGVGNGGQPCMSLSCSSEGVGAAVGSFRSAGEQPAYHSILCPSGDMSDLFGEPSPHEAVYHRDGIQVMDLDPASSSISQGASMAPPPVAGWRMRAVMGGHGYTSRATMSRTAILPRMDGTASRLPWFACADEQSRQLWLWDLSTGNILNKFPPHEGHILSVQSSRAAGSPNVALASLSEQRIQVSIGAVR